MARLECYQFPCLSDNYGVLVHDPDTEATASIDAPDAEAVLAALNHKGWQLTHILVTHHHADHTQGVAHLKSEFGASVIGPKGEAAKIPTLDLALQEGDTLRFGDKTATVIETPGHTKGHIAFWFAEEGLLFAGDTLFALGCGRVFEGTMDEMWQSLQKLGSLPDATTVYCGHEYTQANARFAVTVEPDNDALKTRAAEIDALRAKGEPTLPTTIGVERATNPFLRADEPALKAAIGMPDASGAEVFAEVRQRKDRF